MTDIDITETSQKVFLAYAEDAGNWGGTPLVGGNLGGSKAENGNLTQLKIAGLIVTFDDGERKNLTWIKFTQKGVDYAASLGVDLADYRLGYIRPAAEAQ